MTLALLAKCRVTGPVLKPDGTPCHPATITFTLSRRDRDGEITILPAPVAADTDADGNIAVDLWPNAEGIAGTSYVASVAIGATGRPRTTYPPFNLVVPVAPAANLSEITELVPPASVDDARAAVILAQQAAQDAANSALATAYDRRQTGEDRIATGQDAEATAADRLATAEDREAIAGAAEATTADRIATGEDRVATHADALATADDRRQTGEDREAVRLDALATDDNRLHTGEDRIATAADRDQTGQDRQAAAASAAAANTAKEDAQTAATAANVAKINWRGPYSAGTAYVARDAVSYGNSSWVAKVATTGNAPPALPAISNTWWDLMASKGDAYETYGVSIYRAAGIALGGYYAERSASAGSTQAKLVAEIIAGNVGAEVDFYVEVNGVMAYGPVTVAIGTPVALSGLAIAVGAGAKVSFVVTRMTGAVTEFFAKTYGAL
ncbi:hypothetical protein [Kaistia sp. MMO-174]|uniref:hypothetical protein n=1 Tax=Kaistia sp. MMO-174 TaxID=3081256 RepID=UPI0030177994